MSQEHPPYTMPDSITAWVDADRRLDLPVMEEQLSADVVLVSPLTDRFDFRGPREVMAVFASAFDLLKDIEIRRVTGHDKDWVIHGSQTISGRHMEEIQWLHLDQSGKIDRITLFIRPVPAVLQTLAHIGGGLHRRHVLPRSAVIVSAPVALLARGMALIEKLVMPRVGPRR